MGEKKIIGVIGGMGPLATVNFFERLVRLAPFEKDQEHPRILIDSNPSVPDRTKAILGQGSPPTSVIVETGKNLQRAGADFLAMPCVTAHHFYDDIQAALDIPLIHMILEAAKFYQKHHGYAKAGLLATLGTVQAGIFHRYFPEENLIIPDAETQAECVMKAIYGVKGGGLDPSVSLINRAAERLIERGARVLIAGCTEIPIILKQENISVPVIDPVEILAQACLDRIDKG